MDLMGLDNLARMIQARQEREFLSLLSVARGDRHSSVGAFFSAVGASAVRLVEKGWQALPSALTGCFWPSEECC